MSQSKLSEPFIPPYAPPLKGTEGLIYSTWKFMRNPVEGFGPLSYAQDIVTANALGTCMHVITSPEGMTQVLSQHHSKFPKAPLDNRVLSIATKEGLLSVHGDQWKRQRRAVAPVFRPALLSDFAPNISESLSEFCDGLGEGKVVDLQSAMLDMSFDVLARALLGDAKGVERRALQRDMQKGLEAAGTIRPSDLLPLPRNFPRPISLSGYRATKRIHAAADKLIAQRRRRPLDDLVGLLTSATDPMTGQTLTPREQRDNLTGFLIAGHETTALSLSWALYLLGRVPKMQERLYEEVSQIYPDGSVPYDAVKSLPLCQAIIDETMRLFPPVALLSRQCEVPCEISGREIKKGDLMTLAIYVMHRREAYWTDPHIYNPDRFLENPNLRGKGAPLMPFGGGPRTCVAAAFANMEMNMALAQIVRDFKVEVADTVYPRPKLTITLRPEGGIPARLIRRS